VAKISVQRHPPERGLRHSATAPAGGCCCCCCCCLHTLGGVVGALTARPKKVEEPPIPTATLGKPHVPAKYSATGLYWLIVLLVAGFAVSWDVATNRYSDALDSLFAIVLLGLPVIQIIAMVLALLVVLLSRRPGREQRMLHLAWIGARGLIGAVIGVLVMLPLLKAC
jgi:hypothetical protein